MLVYRKGIGMVPIESVTPKELHFVEDDSMPPVLSQLDGKIYDSKSEIRKSYRRAGVLEVGTEKLSKYLSKTDRKKPIPEKVINEAMEKAYSKLEDPSFRRHFREQERDRYERIIRDGFNPDWRR